jgi:hypothetical protein
MTDAWDHSHVRSLYNDRGAFSHIAIVASMVVVHFCTALTANSGPLSNQVSGNATQDEEVGQNVDHIDRLELAEDAELCLI